MPWSFPRRSASYRKKKEDSGPKRGGLVRLVVTFLLLAWAIRSFVFAAFSIPSVSMLPTLYVGDYMVVAKWPYGYSRFSFPFGFPSFNGRILSDLPKRGDIVVFRGPGSDIDFVKRAIGLPGDRVAVRGGMLVLNGRGISREPEGMVEVPISPNSPCRVVAGASAQLGSAGTTCLYPAYRETLPNGRSWLVLDQVENPRADDWPEIVVPPGHVLMLGDNRDDSLDSRFSPAEGGVGLVPVENLIGRGTLIFWSTDGSAEYWKPWTWFGALRGDRLGSTGSGTER